MSIARDDVIQWMKAFATAVRLRDIDRGTELFQSNCVSFGTVSNRVDSLNELKAEQWLKVWPFTQNFDFDYTSAVIQIDESQAVIISQWSSEGVTSENRAFPRSGRTTIVLQQNSQLLRATHSHFSQDN